MTQQRRGSLLVIFLTVLIDLLGFGIVLPLLPIYADWFGASGLQLGLLMASFSAMQFLFAPLWGRISDRIGRRPVIIVGLLGSVIFYALFGWATVRKSLTLLFIARIGAGIAGATISTAHAYIADTTTLENRSRGMAMIGMAFGLGFTFGPLLGYLAVPDGQGDPGPMPGYTASALSFVALILAWFLLPESLHADSETTERKLLDLDAIGAAFRIPSVGSIVLAIFTSVFAFGMFESTLSLLIKGRSESAAFDFSFQQVCLTFAYIGLVLALVQGGFVRRLSGKVAEGKLAAAGAFAEVIGFLLLIMAARTSSTTWLYAGLTVIVSGFAFVTPSLNALISRRSDPNQQGSVLGVGQSASSLARILGPALGIPLLKFNTSLPMILGAAVMFVAGILIIIASRRGQDFAHVEESA